MYNYINLFIYLSQFISVCLPLYLSVYLSMYLSFCVYICIDWDVDSVCLSFCTFVLFQVYVLEVIRKPLPRYVKFVDPKKALEFECPISLSPLYRPITVKGSNPKHTYSAPFMDSVTRTSKVDLLSGQALPTDWRVVDRELEAKMSAESAVIPLTYGGGLALMI